MNPEQPDPRPDLQRALTDLDARLGRITAEVAEVRAGLAALGGQAGPAPVRHPGAPHPVGPWQPPGAGVGAGA
ncbi:MAG: hypothetical protein ACI39C_11995, partial [Dietzia sp.]